jgi:hypothetical protein
VAGIMSVFFLAVDHILCATMTARVESEYRVSSPSRTAMA